MTARPDDDALSWDGDDDPTLDTGIPASIAPRPVEKAGRTQTDAEVADAAAADATEPAAHVPAATEPAEHTPMGSATLIGFGVLVGFYLLFTIGWVIGGLRLRDHADSTVVDYMLQGSFWLAVFAPALWFGTVVLLTRGARGWVRIVWLVAGVVLLVPWPFIVVGPVAS